MGRSKECAGTELRLRLWLAAPACQCVRKLFFFFFAASAATSAAVTGKGNALLRCCSAVGEREAVRTLPNGIKRNRHYAATKATLSRLRLHLRLLRLQLVVVAAVSVVVVVVVFLRFGLTSQRVNNL